jgi:hypothetical protein
MGVQPQYFTVTALQCFGQCLVHLPAGQIKPEFRIFLTCRNILVCMCFDTGRDA